MTGHSDNGMQGETILWADASLESIKAQYEEFTIHVREEVGGTKLLRCLGYIGFQMVGFWDEMIIERATLYSSHPFLAECERRLKQLPEGGAKTRTATGNRLPEIILIDGCRLWVCASQFQSEPIVR